MVKRWRGARSSVRLSMAEGAGASGGREQSKLQRRMGGKSAKAQRELEREDERGGSFKFHGRRRRECRIVSGNGGGGSNRKSYDSGCVPLFVCCKRQSLLDVAVSAVAVLLEGAAADRSAEGGGGLPCDTMGRQWMDAQTKPSS